MSDTAVVKSSGFNEPVLLASFVTWLFSIAGTAILGHTTLVTSAQWSSLTTILVPVITGVLLTVVGFVVRKYVSPAWKKIEPAVNTLGLTETQLEALAEQIYEAVFTKQLQENALATAHEADLALQIPANAGSKVDDEGKPIS